MGSATIFCRLEYFDLFCSYTATFVVYDCTGEKMFGEVVDILVRLTGGFWRFRLRMRNSRYKFLQRIYKFIYYIYLRNYGGFIGHTANFKSEPCFPHGLNGVFIAGGASIGKNCVIFHQVTIGANPMPFSKTTGLPAIGDNCYIGAGAMIIGAVKVGDNCRIGANCAVSRDIPDNCIVVSSSPRIIEKNERIENKYYRWSAVGPEYFDEGAWILETNKEIVANLAGKL